MKKRLVFASQTYDHVHPQSVRSLRAATFHASTHGNVIWAGDASPDHQAYAAARNNIVESCVNEDIDGIMWADSDMIFPVDAISRIVAHDKPFVTGIYFQREPPHWPLVSLFNEDRQVFNWLTRWPENVLAPVDGCGFGCVYTDIELFRKIDPPWFEYKKFSEDFDFCLKVAELGVQPLVDTGVLCGHLPEPKPVTIENYKKAHPEFFSSETEKSVA